MHMPAEDDSVLERVLVRLPLRELLSEDGLDPGLDLGLRRRVALAQNLKHEGGGRGLFKPRYFKLNR